MAVFLLLGLVCIAATVVLLLRAVALRRQQALSTVTSIGRYGYQPETEEVLLSEPPILTRLDRLAASLGAAVGDRVGAAGEPELEALLRSAGVYTLGPRKLLGYRLLLTVALPLLWLWLAALTSSSVPQTVLVFLLMLFTGWQGPVIYLRRRARLRLEEIDYQMPELIDVLVTTVEAGIGFSGALQMAARHLQGQLGQELRLTLAEQDMGLSTEQALQNMLGRADTPSVRSFVRSILQGEQLGVSIGKILRDLAEEMRKRRRQKAEERAQKAPTKMLFPLVLLIFPGMFVVLLGPAMMSIAHAFQGL